MTIALWIVLTLCAVTVWIISFMALVTISSMRELHFAVRAFSCAFFAVVLAYIPVAAWTLWGTS